MAFSLDGDYVRDDNDDDGPRCMLCDYRPIYEEKLCFQCYQELFQRLLRISQEKDLEVVKKKRAEVAVEFKVDEDVLERVYPLRK